MRTRLIRVVEDRAEAGLLDRAWNAAVDQPVKAAAAAILGAPIAVFSIPYAAGAAAMIGAGTAIAAKRSQQRRIADIKRVKARRYSDESGQALLVAQIYAQHPYPSRSDVFIAASGFHDFIVKEQMAHITQFLRASVPLRSLTIDIVSLKTGKLQGVGSGKGLSIGLEGRSGSDHSWVATWDQPSRISCDTTQLYWMRLFPEIVAAVEGATAGRFSRSMKVESNFGLAAGPARAAEISASWTSGLRFDIVAEYG